MKRCKTNGIGLAVAAAGVGLLFAFFLPASVMVCVEAVLLIAAGILFFLS